MRSNSKNIPRRFYYEKSVVAKERKVFLDDFRKSLSFDPDCGPTASTFMFSYAFAKLNASLRQPGKFDPRKGNFAPHTLVSFFGCRSVYDFFFYSFQECDISSYDIGLILWLRMLV